MGQRGEGSYSVVFFHISNIFEIYGGSKTSSP